LNADPALQLRLLDLQAADTALAQLAHRRMTLPELAALAERGERATRLADDIVDAETRVGDLAGEQRRLENEVDAVRARAARDEQRLQTGGLPPKDLEGLQQREEADATLSELTTQRTVLDGERAELEAARDATFAEIDEGIAERTKERAAVASELPPELMTHYERAREHGGGVGAAMLRNRRCEGCRIELSGSELSAVRTASPDEVVRCDNCRRILVRTAESGL
jgi:predicted  nucleic acid-binding Zn-ribbon protein